MVWASSFGGLRWRRGAAAGEGVTTKSLVILFMAQQLLQFFNIVSQDPTVITKFRALDLCSHHIKMQLLWDLARVNLAFW